MTTEKYDQDFYDATASASTQMALTAHGDMFYLTEQLIRRFSARDETHTVSMWIRDIEENSEVFKWSPTQLLLVARRTLTGTAALWLRSEKIHRSWDELKVAISKEFPDTIDVKKIHEMMSARHKKNDETCIDYMLVMKELGKRGKIPDYVAIKYIVDGIIDDEINKIMLYGVTTYADLKEKLKLYAMFKTNAAKVIQRSNETRRSSNNRSAAAMMRCFSCGGKDHTSDNCPHQSQGKKCIYCNDFGHISPNCPLKMKKMAMASSDLTGLNQTVEHASTLGIRQTSDTIGGPERFSKVGTSAEQGRPTNQMSKTAFFSLLRGGATSSANDEAQDNDVQADVYIATTSVNTVANDLCNEVGYMKPQSMTATMTCDTDVVKFDNQNVNKQSNKETDEDLPIVRRENRKKPLKTVFVRGKTSSALIDSGSDVNLMSKDFHNELPLDSAIQQRNENNITLTGLGNSLVKSCGVVTLDIMIDNCIYRDITFHVMPNDSVPFKMILGNDFLQNVLMFLMDYTVWISPKENWMNKWPDDKEKDV